MNNGAAPKVDGFRLETVKYKKNGNVKRLIYKALHD